LRNSDFLNAELPHHKLPTITRVTQGHGDGVRSLHYSQRLWICDFLNSSTVQPACTVLYTVLVLYLIEETIYLL